MRRCAHLSAFLLAYNHAKRLKALRGLTPHEFVCREWQREPDRFVRDPVHEPLGPYTYKVNEAVMKLTLLNGSVGT